MNNLEKFYFNLPIWLQEKSLSLYAQYRNKQFRKNKYYNEAVYLIKKMETMSASEMEQWQLRQLNRMVNYVLKNIPFYQQFYQKKEFSFTDLNDFKTLPTIDKNTVRKHWGDFQAKLDEKVFKTHTSGTTGSSLQLRISRQTTAVERAGIDYYRNVANYKHGDKIASFIGRKIMKTENSHPPFWRYNSFDRQLLFSNWHVSESTLPSYIEKFNSFRPDFVNGYPSFLYLVAEFALRNRIKLFKSRAIFTGSETLLSYQRESIEKAFGNTIFDHYGTSEQLIMAYQCVQGQYHIREELGYLEVIDGEIYGTSFWNKAMPLIRYRIGDTAQIKTVNCSCGVSGRVLINLQGRNEDIIQARSGKKYGRLDHLFKDTNSVKEAQIIQISIEHLIVKIVPMDRSTLNINEIKEEFSKKLGAEFELTYEIVDLIPRTMSGKFRFVVSKLNNNE